MDAPLDTKDLQTVSSTAAPSDHDDPPWLASMGGRTDLVLTKPGTERYGTGTCDAACSQYRYLVRGSYSDNNDVIMRSCQTTLIG